MWDCGQEAGRQEGTDEEALISHFMLGCFEKGSRGTRREYRELGGNMAWLRAMLAMPTMPTTSIALTLSRV